MKHSLKVLKSVRWRPNFSFPKLAIEERILRYRLIIWNRYKVTSHIELNHQGDGMKGLTVFLLVCNLFLASCAMDPSVNSVRAPQPTGPIDYTMEIKPILEKRCVVCHSCYNSPCQLKLSSYEGLERGATKKEVYNSKRLLSADPTRLFVDAQTTDKWRKKGFYSVTESSAQEGYNNSLLLRLISHKTEERSKVDQEATTNLECSADNDKIANCPSYQPEKDDLACAKNDTELNEYLEKHPNRGMPYGFPPLTQQEFEKIRDWMARGGEGPSPEEMSRDRAIAKDDLGDVKEWEQFLNPEDNDPQHVMTARYLYEHLFLAHISFSPTGKNFYELVRSKSPAGEPVEVIPTVRPYDDPYEYTDGKPFYYRFRRIHSTIVHKTHMVFEMNSEKLERVKTLFIKPNWLVDEPYIESYDDGNSANPFLVFRQIPPRVRYQFLLDNIHYTIMTFIRGPVCKGQVALNVVNDHFWLMFMDPEYDQAVIQPEYLREKLDLLRIPNENGSFLSLFKPYSITYKYGWRAIQYTKERQKQYWLKYRNTGLPANAIWKGNTGKDSPVLTVFRHFDSASVHKGARGELPKTIWVLDYPLVERIYYALVAGFDVYGSVGHQAAVRLYMSHLRQEGETYFLDFLPKLARKHIMSEWNGGLSPEKITYQPSTLSAHYNFKSDNPKREYMEYLVKEHFIKAAGVRFDENYRMAFEEPHPEIPESLVGGEEIIRGFHAVAGTGVPFFQEMNDFNANLAYILIEYPNGENEKPIHEVVSMVVHRWHDDVRTLNYEDKRLDPAKDQADFFKGFIGSYPNYIFKVKGEEELRSFLMAIKDFDISDTQKICDVLKFGVNRNNPKFWTYFDLLQDKFIKDEPLRGGYFDLNRYYRYAIPGASCEKK